MWHFGARNIVASVIGLLVLFLLLTPGSLRSEKSTSVSTKVWVGSSYKFQPVQHRVEQTREEFLHAWNAYAQHTLPQDSLSPLDQGSATTNSAWGATVFDGLSTAIMMDMPDIVSTMLSHIEMTDMTTTNGSVSFFGVVIRYLGGLLSAHDLLLHTGQHMDRDGAKARMLLDKAIDLARTLNFAYNTSSGIPQNNLRLLPQPGQKRTPVTDTTAAGVPAFELTHLARLTRSRIDESALAALNNIIDQLNNKPNPFPGLAGRTLSIKSGEIVDAVGGWYGGAGGLYEYLLKLYLMDNARFAHCRKLWEQVVHSSMTYLISHPSTAPDLTFLASYDGTDILYNTDHTAHFAAANFLLGGAELQRQDLIDLGLQLVDTQIEMYRATMTGLGPDQYAWLPLFCRNINGFEDRFDPMNSRPAPDSCRINEMYQNQTDFYHKAGFYNTNAQYKLRPEVLESLYYAYRITGQERYREASWEIFEKIVEHTKIESGGFASLKDVNQLPNKAEAIATHGEKGGMVNMQHSYMLAETIKYAWLAQIGDDASTPWHVQHDGMRGWLFNTEGHPIKVQKF